MQVARLIKFIVITAGLSISSTAVASTALPPCTCYWDGSTKQYPSDGRSQSFGRTTVNYNCGYVCADSNGTIHHVIGGHTASYRTEVGNEVICDGLTYRAQQNPSGSHGRWITYAWDGVFNAFDARRSASPDLRNWGTRSCGSSAEARATNRSAIGIDDLRENAGLPRLSPLPDPRLKARATSPDREFEALCRWTEAQLAFRSESHPQELTGCEPGRDRSAVSDWSLVQRSSFRRSEEAPSESLVSSISDILLCPYTIRTPTPAMMNLILERLAERVRREASSSTHLSEAACSMSLRGLRWNQVSRKVRNLITGQTP